MKSEQMLAKAMVELSDTLVDGFDDSSFLHGLCVHSVDLFNVDAAGVMLIDAENQLQVLASSSKEAEFLDQFQIDTGQGPCVSSYQTREPVLAKTSEALLTAWPVFGARANKLFASVYAFPMRHDHKAFGALNLYGRHAEAMSASDIPLGQALADVATVSMLRQHSMQQADERSEHLQTALNSRVTIEQAKGKYAERHRSDVDTAFQALRTYSQNNNLKLTDVAAAFLNDDIDLTNLTRHRTPPVEKGNDLARRRPRPAAPGSTGS